MIQPTNSAGITNISYKGKLIPKSEYKGTVLKLTKADKAQIEKLQNEKADLECGLYKLIEYCKNKLHSNISDSMEDQIILLETRIEVVDYAIKQIKLNRLKKQAEKVKKKLDVNV